MSTASTASTEARTAPDTGRASHPLARLAAPLRLVVNAPYRLVVVILALWVGCSLAYALIEDKGPVESLWWGVVTGSTVGYGDFYPDSTAGRGVAVVLIVSMLVLVPIAIGHVIANLVLDRNQFTHVEQVALAEALESVHDRVDRVEFLVMASLSEAHGPEWVQEQVAAFERVEKAGHDVDDRMLALFRSASE